MYVQWICRLFQIILDIFVRQDKAMLHGEESGFKMYKKHEDHRNSASSQGRKYIIKETPQGFLP